MKKLCRRKNTSGILGLERSLKSAQDPTEHFKIFEAQNSAIRIYELHYIRHETKNFGQISIRLVASAHTRTLLGKSPDQFIGAVLWFHLPGIETPVTRFQIKHAPTLTISNAILGYVHITRIVH